MAFKKGENPHHPRKGSSIRCEPIRDLNDIKKIKQHLLNQERYRDLCLFDTGINTAWRANELLSISIGQVMNRNLFPPVTLKQSKTQDYRQTPINDNARSSIDRWLEEYKRMHPRRFKPEAKLFVSQRAPALTVPTVSTMIKNICREVDIIGQHSSHTMRKTWGYHQRMTYDVPLFTIMRALGHKSEHQTAVYIGILPEDVTNIYQNTL